MSRFRLTALTALVLGALTLPACNGGDAVPTGPADGGVDPPLGETEQPLDDAPTEQLDPTDELEEPDPHEAPPDADPDVSD